MENFIFCAVNLFGRNFFQANLECPLGAFGTFLVAMQSRMKKNWAHFLFL